MSVGEARDSPFWKAVRGEIAPPPSAALLGWKVLEASPGTGRVTIEFDATDRFSNVVGNIQGAVPRDVAADGDAVPTRSRPVLLSATAGGPRTGSRASDPLVAA